MAELNKMYQDLKKAGNKPLPTVALITIDPKRDTVKRMHDYVQSFNKNFVGVRGSAEQIKSLTSNLGVLYMKVAQDQKTSVKQENYDIDHSGTVFLINPEGHLAALFSMPHRADNLAKDFVKIEKHNRKMFD